jgi:hypothetical protein
VSLNHSRKMRISLALVALILMAAGIAIPQSNMGYARQAGQELNEAWGNWQNPNGLCWTSGPSGCYNFWTVGGGTANSIAACPGTPTLAQTGGPNCLKMTEVAATAGYLFTNGTFSPSPSGTTQDFFFPIYVTSQTIANFDAEPLFCASTDTACGTFAARLQWAPTSGNLQIEGVGSTTSSRSTTVTLNAYHLMHLHIDSTAASCSVAFDANSALTFTCNTNQVKFFVFGDPTGNLDAITEYFGRAYGGPSTISVGYPPNVLVNATGTNAASVTTTTLAADTSGGNGVWSTAGGTTALTYDNTTNQSYPVPVTINGVQHNTVSTGVSYLYDPSKTSEAFTYTFSTPYPACSVRTMFWYNLTDTTNFYTFGNSALTSGSDPLGIHYFNGTLYLNTPTGTVNANGTTTVTWVSGQKFTTGTYWNGLAVTINGTGYTISSVTDSTHFVTTGNVTTGSGVTYTLVTNGPSIAVSPSTWYELYYQLNQSGQYTLTVYNAAGTSAIGTIARATTATGPCTSICMGRDCGADTAFTGSGGWRFNNWVVDYVQAR